MSNSELQNTDYTHIRGIYAYLNVAPLTMQEEAVLLNHMRGMSLFSAARAAGMPPSKATAMMKKPDMEVIQDYFRHQMIQGIKFGLEEATQMYLEAHRKSANATEEIKATDSLSRLHMLGGFAPATIVQLRASQEEKEVGPKTAKELESMSEGQLLELADFAGMGDLSPTADEEVVSEQ